jgi:hypothetical protein
VKIDIIKKDGVNIAVVVSDSIEINNIQDALDLMVNCQYREARKIIINKKNIAPVFFDLKTGIAGEILQKFINYQVQLAIVGDFSEFSSKSLTDFMYESNKTGRIFFVDSVDEAKRQLAA